MSAEAESMPETFPVGCAWCRTVYTWSLVCGSDGICDACLAKVGGEDE